MIKLVFEDYEGSVLSLFYKKFYRDTSSFVWTGGNSAMWTRVRDNQVSNDDYEILFYDFNPWNWNIIRLYNLISKRIRKMGYHYIVLPIVCSEFKYLCSLDNRYLTDKDITHKLRSIINLEDLIGTVEGISTYEEYCKYAVQEFVIKEARIDMHDIIIPEYCKTDTFGDSLFDKWTKYITKYEVFLKISDKLIDNTLLKCISGVTLTELFKLQEERANLCEQWRNSVNVNHDLHLHSVKSEWYK